MGFGQLMILELSLVATVTALHFEPPPLLSRRAAITAGIASLPLLPDASRAAVLEPSAAYENGISKPDAGRAFYEVILPPVQNRATVRTAIGRGENGDGMWGFEQLLLFANVSATIRMTVVRLQDGTLWVNAPVAPTGECLALLRELGDVSHIVLPVSALEHKAFFGPFVRSFPRAQTWVSPGQYGPFGELKPRSPDGSGRDGYDISMPYKVDGVLGDASNPPPWADELPYKLFYVDLPGNAGPVSEAAFFHRASKTLVCTDAVVFVPPTAPPLFSTIFDAATFADKDFWPKSVLQAVFLPLRQADDGGWPGYERVRGRLLRAPILRAFGDVRAPEQTKAWVDDITSGEWPFDRIVSGHFASPIGQTSPAEFKAAFGRLYGESEGLKLDERDWATLDGLNDLIETNKLGAPLKAGYK